MDLGPTRAISRRQLVVSTAAVAGTTSVWPVLPGAARDVPPEGAEPGAPASRLASTWAADWVDTCFDLVWREGPTPPNAARCYAYVAIAMYEAARGGMPRHRSLGRQLNGLGRMPEPPGGTVDWAVALAGSAHAAAHTVYAGSAPERLATLDALLERQVDARRAAGVRPVVVRRSLGHGRAVAASVAAWISGDGYAGTVGRDWTPPVGESLWVSTPPNFRPAIEPYWSEVRPIVMRSAGEVEPVPHLPFSTEPGSPFRRQAETVLETGRALTDEQRAIARFWTDNPLLSGLPSGHWMRLVTQVAAQQRLDLGATVEALALAGIALHDAFLSCWTAKYRYHLLRPVTYINRYLDPGFATFVNSPQFPEYTSGHSVASRATSTVLTALLGRVAFLDDSHRDRDLPARAYADFHAAADEAAQSRLYGGIHYPMGIENGKDHGDLVGLLVLARVRTRR